MIVYITIPHFTLLCYVISHTIFCYIVVYCILLYCIVFYCIMLDNILPHLLSMLQVDLSQHIIICCTLLYYIRSPYFISYSNVFVHVLLYYTMLPDIILNYIMSYYVI